MDALRVVLLVGGAGLLGYGLWRWLGSGPGFVATDWGNAQSVLSFDPQPPATDWLQGAYDTMTGQGTSAGVTSASASGAAAIKAAEGLRLTAYPDASGYSIGYGHFGATAGQTITEAQAEALFEGDLQAVEDAINGAVTVPLSQNQYDALADFVFNVGVNAFKGSTLLTLLNQGNYAGAAEQFARWKYSEGTVNQSLVARREAEQQLFTG